MAKCTQCGRQLPLLTFGKQRNVCKWCQEYQAAQRGEEVSDVQPVIRNPWRQRSHDPVVMYAILGVNVAVFLGMALAGVSLSSPGTQELVHWGANFGPLTFSGQWWRLVTCMFLHIGLLHIAFNMWCLWDLGSLAEALYGKWTFAAIYLATGVASSLASLWWHPITVSAGASGAIFGITGALIASFKLGEFSLPSAQIHGVLRSVLVFAGYNLVFGAISSRTDNAAHIGGLVTGLIMGAAVAKLAPVEDDSLRRITLLAVLGLVVLGAGTWLYKSRSYMVHTARAEQLFARGGTRAEGIAELKKALAAKPDDVHAHYLLALAYSETAQVDEAEKQWKYLLERNPKENLARYNLGLLYLNTKRADSARREFSQMLAVDPQSGEAHYGLGLTLAEQDQAESAIAEFKKAIDLDADVTHLYYNLGAAYAHMKLYDDAIAAFNKSVETDGDNAETQTALARMYAAKGLKDRADAALTKAEQLKKQGTRE